jgi:hypothetical protein
MNNLEIKNKLAIVDEGDQTFIEIDGLNRRYSINQKGLLYDNKLKRMIYPLVVDKKFLSVVLSVNGVSIRFN